MPPEGPRIKTEENWDPVNYVRSLSKKEPDADQKAQQKLGRERAPRESRRILAAVPAKCAPVFRRAPDRSRSRFHQDLETSR